MKENLLIQTAIQKHELMDGELVVGVKEPTFLDLQRAAQHLMRADNLNLEDYWRYAFTHWVVVTEPELTTDELLLLKPEVGKALSDTLPSPEDMVAMLGFSTAKSDSSTTI